ncbi:MAG: hypothetical protein HY263_06080 [Chloroflexi bacterium]|nr:hypothetical protein [Chloroflexota bacterium]
MSKRPRWILAVLLLAGAGGLLAATRLLPAAEAGRSSPLPGLVACATTPPLGPGAAAEPGAFFRTEAHLDADGGLVGRRLYVGEAGQVAATTDLPAESAMTGPIDGVVVVTADDGARSIVQLVSVRGCATTVHATASVVRRAIADPLDGSILMHLVDRSTRADLGVWRLAAGTERPQRILEPLPASLHFGTVWATDLVLDPTGRRLAVQSCQDRACLTRILDLARPSDAPIVLRGSGQGPMLGFAGDRLVTWAACDGLPCAILAWDGSAGGPTTLVADASAAGLTGDGHLLVAVVADGTGDHALVVDLTSGTVRPLRGLARGERPVARGGIAAAGLELAPDQIAVGQPAGEPHAIRPSAAGEVLS